MGSKSAQRYAFSILAMDEKDVLALSEALLKTKKEMHACPVCGSYTVNNGECDICADTKRSDAVLCVVETARDVFYMDSAQNGFDGKYNVLGGVLSPIDGVTPSDLNIQSLVNRVKTNHTKEVIIATEPDVEGEV